MTSHSENPQNTTVTRKLSYYFEVISHLTGSQPSNATTLRLNNSAACNADCVITIGMYT